MAKELRVPFIDLHTASVNYHNQIGREASMTFNPASEDMTHFNRKGANAMAALIVQEIKSSGMDIAEYFTCRRQADTRARILIRTTPTRMI